MFLKRRVQGGTRHFIPDSFIGRAFDHIQETGQPLLYRRLPSYPHVLEAWPNGDGYTLSIPLDYWDPPFVTWRQYAEYKGISLQEVMDDQDFDDEEELNEEIPEDKLEDYVDPEDTLEAQTEELVGDLPEYLIEDPGDLAPFLQDTFVEIYEYGGAYPGDPWTGRTHVSVRSKLALSLLQYVLDELGRGVRIELRW